MSEKSLKDFMNKNTTEGEVIENKKEEEKKETIVEDTKKEELKTARDAHSATPTDSLSNLKNVLDGMDDKLEEYEKMLEKAKENEKLDKAVKEISTVDKKQFNDIIEEEGETKVNLENVKKETASIEDKQALISIKIKKVKNKKDVYNDLVKKRKLNEEVTQVVLGNSGYSASMSGLSSAEIRNNRINMQRMTPYESTKYEYSILHEKMKNTSLGYKMNYEEFLRVSSVLELNTLYFGLFCSTYPEINEYPFVCDNPKCTNVDPKKEFTVSYPNTKLLLLDEDNKENTINNIMEVINAKNSKELLEQSDVNNITRYQLKNGDIIDLRHPSLYDNLEDTISKLTDNMVGDDNTIYPLLPFVNAIYVPYEDGYLELDECDEKFTELSSFDDNDLATVAKGIKLITDKYAIKYGFRNVVCPHCGHIKEEKIITDMSDLIFFMQETTMEKEN